MIKAYLSHRRENNGLSAFAQSLLDWAPEDICLKTDCRDAIPSSPIDAFIGELETSSSVVFLLRDEYFKSPYCMRELHTFLSRRNASFHGFFIACDDWLPKSDIREFFAGLKESLVSHWRQSAVKATEEPLKREAHCFSEHLPEMIEILSRYNFPVEQKIREKRGEQVWKRLSEQNERNSTDYAPCLGETLNEECRRQLVDGLEHCGALCGELARVLKLDSQPNASEVVAKLWNQEDGVARKLNEIYRAAEKALHHVEPHKRQKLQVDIRDILGVALLGMLDTGARDKVLTPRYGFLDSLFLEVSESVPEIVELCFSTAEREPVPRLDFDPRLRQLTVSPERRYDSNRVESGRLYTCDSMLDAQLRLVWKLNFPNEEKKNNAYLTDQDFRRLNKALKRNFERGHARYYLVPHDDAAHPLNQAGVIGALKYKLPYLFAFRTGVASQPKLISVAFDEGEITDELTDFSKLFSNVES